MRWGGGERGEGDPWPSVTSPILMTGGRGGERGGCMRGWESERRGGGG